MSKDGLLYKFYWTPARYMRNGWFIDPDAPLLPFFGDAKASAAPKLSQAEKMGQQVNSLGSPVDPQPFFKYDRNKGTFEYFQAPDFRGFSAIGYARNPEQSTVAINNPDTTRAYAKDPKAENDFWDTNAAMLLDAQNTFNNRQFNDIANYKIKVFSNIPISQAAQVYNTNDIVKNELFGQIYDKFKNKRARNWNNFVPILMQLSAPRSSIVGWDKVNGKQGDLNRDNYGELTSTNYVPVLHIPMDKWSDEMRAPMSSKEADDLYRLLQLDSPRAQAIFGLPTRSDFKAYTKGMTRDHVTQILNAYLSRMPDFNAIMDNIDKVKALNDWMQNSVNWSAQENPTPEDDYEALNYFRNIYGNAMSGFYSDPTEARRRLDTGTDVRKLNINKLMKLIPLSNKDIISDKQKKQVMDDMSNDLNWRDIVKKYGR